MDKKDKNRSGQRGQSKKTEHASGKADEQEISIDSLDETGDSEKSAKSSSISGGISVDDVSITCANCVMNWSDIVYHRIAVSIEYRNAAHMPVRTPIPMDCPNEGVSPAERNKYAAQNPPTITHKQQQQLILDR